MNVQTLTFTANEQILTKTDNLAEFASNTVSYVEATFSLGDNWTGYDSIRAVWKTNYYTISTVLDGNNTCVVPTEALMYKAKVYVNLVGSIVSGDTLTDRLTTFPALALTVTEKAQVEGSETAAVTPSQFEQFVSSVEEAAQSVTNYSHDSEAWAVGKRGGVDVTSGDETYQNNSKYWAQEAASELSDLKDDLDKSIFDAPLNNLFTATNQETGVFYNASGVKETYANYNSSTLIPLGDATKLVVTCPISTVVTFWDSNSSFVSSKSVGGNTQTNVFVPNEAEYYRIFWSKTKALPTVLANSESQYIEKKIYDRTGQFPLFDIFTVDGRELGGFYNNTGTWDVYEPYASTKLIEIPTNTKVIKHYSRKGRTDVVTFWDSNSTFISGGNASSNENKSVPSNAKYVRCSFYRIDDEYPQLLCDTIPNISKGVEQAYYTFNFYGDIFVAQEDAISMPSKRSNTPIVIKQNNDLIINCNSKQFVISPSNISVSHPVEMVADGTYVTTTLSTGKALLLDVNNNNIFIQNRTANIPLGCILLASSTNGVISDGVFAKIISDLDSQIYNRDYLNIGGYGVCEFVIDDVASDHTFIGNDLYFFTNNANDHLSYSLCEVYTVDFINKTATLKTDFYQNWGHCNTVDYNEGNDCFILGNGAGSETMDYNEFYVVPNASNLADIVDGGQASLNNYAITYRASAWGASSWGKQLNVVWGDSNRDRNDMAYLVSNDGTFMYIRLIQLAKGSNEFDNGTLITGKSDSEFNGTWRVVNTWTTPYATDVALQGGTYHDGKLYFGYGHDGISYEVFNLGINGNVRREMKQFDHYDASGTKLSLTTEGLAIKNGLLFIGSDSDAEHITYAYKM